MPGGQGTTVIRETELSRRDLYTHNDYVELVLGSGRPLTHEYDECSVEEDPRMLAFFDSLIQRELSGLNSDSTGTLSPDEFYANFAHPDSSSSSDEDDVGISITRIRELLSLPATSERARNVNLNVTNESVRGTRVINRWRMFRELLNSETLADSSSDAPSDTGEELQVPLVLPSPPRSDSEGTETEMVSFRRSQTARRRRYRRRILCRRTSRGNSSSDDDGGLVDDDVDNDSIALTSAVTTSSSQAASLENSNQDIESSYTEGKLFSDQAEVTETKTIQLSVNGKLCDKSFEKDKKNELTRETCVINNVQSTKLISKNPLTSENGTISVNEDGICSHEKVLDGQCDRTTFPSVHEACKACREGQQCDGIDKCDQNCSSYGGNNCQDDLTSQNSNSASKEAANGLLGSSRCDDSSFSSHSSTKVVSNNER